ncbi:TetR/AcrR family transcriptional regulator [Streptacidiphilus melanogenes]|uniref:TetR/AcrR family transcriptional regulator n=1 Tax=Streptacidiphilus melanogenes TaxID=411235 RepID=UPI0005AA54C7|nr:TetR/AcrR family transcriptional regulator [Streptacidiphilus melanogenes]
MDEKDGARRRPLRADAQLNEDRVLRAAAEAFTRDGVDASVKDIARAAGVGVGTLYRRFPSKELLVEATYRNEVRALCEAAPILAASSPPREALRTWMVRFMEFMAAKHGMAAALRVVLSDEGERLQTRTDLTEAVHHLLGTGVARAGVTARDVLMALGGISLIAENDQDPELAVRLIDLLLNGVLKAPTVSA